MTGIRQWCDVQTGIVGFRTIRYVPQPLRPLAAKIDFSGLSPVFPRQGLRPCALSPIPSRPLRLCRILH